jgi:hypothetical protein
MPQDIQTTVSLLDSTNLSLEELRSLLASPDSALVHATVLHISRRFRAGEKDPSAWASLLPADLYALPPESQLELAELAITGLPLPPIEVPVNLAPSIQLAWLRVELLQDPASFPKHERSQLGRHAIEGYPVERVISSGLLEQLVRGTEPHTLCITLTYLRAGLEEGLLDR